MKSNYIWQVCINGIVQTDRINRVQSSKETLRNWCPVVLSCYGYPYWEWIHHSFIHDPTEMHFNASVGKFTVHSVHSHLWNSDKYCLCDQSSHVTIPGTMLISLMHTALVILSWALRTFETYLNLSESSYFNSMWCTTQQKDPDKGCSILSFEPVNVREWYWYRFIQKLW